MILNIIICLAGMSVVAAAILYDSQYDPDSDRRKQ